SFSLEHHRRLAVFLIVALCRVPEPGAPPVVAALDSSGPPAQSRRAVGWGCLPARQTHGLRNGRWVRRTVFSLLGGHGSLQANPRGGFSPPLHPGADCSPPLGKKHRQGAGFCPAGSLLQPYLLFRKTLSELGRSPGQVAHDGRTGDTPEPPDLPRAAAHSDSVGISRAGGGQPRLPPVCS